MAVNICNLNNKLKMFLYNKNRTLFLIDVNVNYVVILLFYLLCSVPLAFGIELHTKECSAIKMDFMSRGFNASDLLPYPVNGIFFSLIFIIYKILIHITIYRYT